MEIRHSNKEDIPGIVNVLKLSLGEDDLPLSGEIWNYKHINNPFGQSIVLIAEEDQRIIGVRALMKWSWQRGEEIFTGLRAVDTATHPEHQGKGIFKKLTLQAIDLAEQKKYDFVFNTPNEKSRPGYIKMGWQKADKLEVGILLTLKGVMNFGSKVKYYKHTKQNSEKGLQILLKSWNNILASKGVIFTPKTTEFLRWRYESNPLQEYEIYCDNTFYLAGYVKFRKGLKELRISELIWNQNSVTAEIKNKIGQWAAKFGVHFITFSPRCFINYKMAVKGNFGPILTLRQLRLVDQSFLELKSVSNWEYSLGDLELY